VDPRHGHDGFEGWGIVRGGAGQDADPLTAADADGGRLNV